MLFNIYKYIKLNSIFLILLILNSCAILTELKIGLMPRQDQIELSMNENTDPDVLRALAKNKDREIQRNLARNPNTPPEILSSLAKDSDSDIRTEVARNPNTPPEILNSLAKDSFWKVQMEVARNPNTPPEILSSLAMDTYEGTRTEVACNENTNLETLMLLVTDFHEKIRKDALRNLRKKVTNEKESDLLNLKKQNINSSILVNFENVLYKEINKIDIENPINLTNEKREELNFLLYMYNSLIKNEKNYNSVLERMALLKFYDDQTLISAKYYYSNFPFGQFYDTLTKHLLASKIEGKEDLVKYEIGKLIKGRKIQNQKKYIDLSDSVSEIVSDVVDTYDHVSSTYDNEWGNQQILKLLLANFNYLFYERSNLLPIQNKREKIKDINLYISPFIRGKTRSFFWDKDMTYYDLVVIYKAIGLADFEKAFNNLGIKINSKYLTKHIVIIELDGLGVKTDTGKDIALEADAYLKGDIGKDQWLSIQHLKVQAGIYCNVLFIDTEEMAIISKKTIRVEGSPISQDAAIKNGSWSWSDIYMYEVYNSMFADLLNKISDRK